MIGHTLDEKYKIESEIGRGGMGTVYLATHLGTERPVAIKVIAPQYMQRPEFVERFRREARAAGRLRHPNVVDVTDFGFAHTKDGQVAYLVMEYLDGCTLGEILEEEKNLPVSWTLDILDQVCSAVQEAHDQGIIHRDLKPDNIWLEPNQRGGYTVKVLDFGIAKLETHGTESLDHNGRATGGIIGGRYTIGDFTKEETIHDSISPTLVSESGTMAGLSEAGTAVIEVREDTDGSEKRTAILLPIEVSDQETVGTQIISDAADQSIPHTIRSTSFDSTPTKDLTRVGAVLGTPLYMSPEQCKGEHLDARSDIYSLGVIAYQMLSGETPFRGDFTEIMESHKAVPPPPLKAKKVRKKLKGVIATALSKEADNRPQTAEAFASSLRSRSEGIWDLLRRAVMIYTEHLPKFLGITILLFLPFIATSLLNVVLGVFYVIEGTSEDSPIRGIAFAVITAISTFSAFFCGYLAVGTITWVVNQVLAVPLRPVRMRPALRATWKNWKRLAGTGFLQSITIFAGLILCVLPGIAATVLLSLVAPVVMMEGVRGIAAFKRSKLLVMRSLTTTIAAVAILFIIPLAIGGTISLIVALSVDKATQISEKINKEENSGNPAATDQASNNSDEDPDEVLNIHVGTGRNVAVVDGENKKPSNRMAAIARETLQSLLMLPVQIILTSLSAIIFALLYLKTRQAGGENLSDLFVQFEETEHPRKKWQERVKQRLIQSGRVTSKPTG